MIGLVLILACSGPLLLCAGGVVAALWLLHGGTPEGMRVGGIVMSMTFLLAAPIASGVAVQTLMRWSLPDERTFTLSLLAALGTLLYVLCAPEGLQLIVGVWNGALPTMSALLGGITKLTWIAGLSVCIVMGGALLCEVPFRIVAATCGMKGLGTSADSFRWLLSLVVLVVGWSLVDEAIAGTARDIAHTLMGKR
jgi:hypothetical protein